MNLSQLKFVKATSELKSFSKAAQVCHVTQPTLSNGVSQLEEELGEKIFFRTTRKVELTPFGKILLPTIASLLSLEGIIYLNAKEFSNPKTVILKIGMSPLVSTKVATLLANSYKAQNRKHKILLIEDNLSVLDQKLEKRELDLILVPVVKRASSKHSIRLYEEDLFLVDNVGKANITAARTQDFEHSPNVILINVNRKRFDRLTAQAIECLFNDLRSANGKLVSFAAHIFQQYAKVQ